ncbi:hypothetical protein [Sphingomonas colocasiae]|uniref:Uncharacterized protein n=1 Tax=Sphingomonas colocasiae TaxID=1848973 RepID=A0ABS7PNA6_9SPHN|nr:hypothetical protein [Sphingomonas colocasiae]MBY8822787.1 hypothetical protein [Sphingomonas colocasiae]
MIQTMMALLAIVFTNETNACSYVSPPTSKIAKEVAAKGVLIRGRIIQVFDPVKRRPEIIRAQEIFVGKGKPRNFVIYSSKSDYDSALELRRKMKKKSYIPSPCSGMGPGGYVLGESLERLVLMPAKASNGKAVAGQWSHSFWGGNVSGGMGLDMLVVEARRLGRFQKPPPSDPRSR